MQSENRINSSCESGPGFTCSQKTTLNAPIFRWYCGNRQFRLLSGLHRPTRSLDNNGRALRKVRPVSIFSSEGTEHQFGLLVRARWGRTTGHSLALNSSIPSCSCSRTSSSWISWILSVSSPQNLANSRISQIKCSVVSAFSYDIGSPRNKSEWMRSGWLGWQAGRPRLIPCIQTRNNSRSRPRPSLLEP